MLKAYTTGLLLSDPFLDEFPFAQGHIGLAAETHMWTAKASLM